MLRFAGLHKSYDDHHVLDIPSLQLNKGMYWLKGENGSGKTTLLKMTAGMIPFEGEIEINGAGCKQSPLAYRRMVSWSDAEPLYPSFITGQTIIDLYSNIRNASLKNTEHILVRLAMTKWIKDRIGTYSSGMVKKLSLALAFIGTPEFILLDEPLTTLDITAVPAVIELINKMYSEGSSFIISSHQDIGKSSLMISKELVLKNKSILPHHE